MSLPGVMQHLKVLDDAGLTISEKRGRVRCGRQAERPSAGTALKAWIGDRRRPVERAAWTRSSSI